MNATAKIEAADPLARLREPFPAHHISKLPKPTKAQTEAVRADFKKGVRCQLCGSWHHPEVVHLDYVGHAALTDRLLDTDPAWSWEPLAVRDGLPAFDASGGLWIKLTVCGVSRLGYGHAAAKQNVDPGAREKEVIGDALRNAAMRFGAALDLWHKGDLHLDIDEDAPAPAPVKSNAAKGPAQEAVAEPACGWGDWGRETIRVIEHAKTLEALDAFRTAETPRILVVKKVDKAIFDAIRKADADKREMFAKAADVSEDQVPC